MKTPFPGMDPYLEGYLWPDVHNELSSAIKALLVPLIAPKYVARIELYTVEDATPETEIGIMYPDVEVLLNKKQLEEPTPAYDSAQKITEPTVVIPEITPVEVRIPVVEIRDSAQNQLITAIEILSPVNKKPPGLDKYREKRKKLHSAGIHLLELDLLRRGTRAIRHPSIPQTHYLSALTRAGSGKTEVWAFNIQDPLPVLPVPLASADPDVRLELKTAIDTIFERSRYELSIDYNKQPPPPPFSDVENTWMSEQIAAWKSKQA